MEHSNALTIDWDSQENKAAVDTRISGLLKGCKCKAGCSTKRYSYRSKGNECSIGCDCINCTNTQGKGNEDLLDIVVDEYLAEVNDESIGLPVDVNDIMDWVFGDEDFEGDENFDSEHYNVNASYSVCPIYALASFFIL